MRRSPDSIASRTAAAIVGGYIVANTVAFVVAAAMPMSEADAVLVAMQVSYLFYAFAVLWAFAAKTARRAWTGLSGTALVTLLIWAGLRLG